MNKPEILKMMEYSGMSYKNIWPKEEGSQVFFLNDKKTDVQCFIIKKGSTLTIVFRGSNSLKDVMIDLEFWKMPVSFYGISSKIKIHSGFFSTYKSKNIQNKIQSFVTEDIEKIRITGHSYGAALSIICAVDLEHSFPDKDYEVIVFGCPRVGNQNFKNHYNRKIFKTLRVENRGDIITRVPPAFIGYRHVGAKFSIGSIFRRASLKHHGLLKYYSFIWNKF